MQRLSVPLRKTNLDFFRLPAGLRSPGLLVKRALVSVLLISLVAAYHHLYRAGWRRQLGSRKVG